MINVCYPANPPQEGAWASRLPPQPPTVVADVPQEVPLDPGQWKIIYLLWQEVEHASSGLSLEKAKDQGSLSWGHH